MKLIKFISVIIFFGLVSCKSHKEIHKTENKENTITDTKSVTDRTVTAEADTNAVSKESVIFGEKTLAELFGNDSLVVENDVTKTVVKLSPDKKKIVSKTTKKREEIPVKFKTTIIEKEKKEEHKKNEISKKTFDKDKQVDSGFNWNWLWLIVAGIIIFFIWWFTGFRRKKQKTET